MYYDNKTEFYLKQYGARVLVLCVSILLIFGGSVIYIRNNTLPRENVTAETDTNNGSSSIDIADATVDSNDSEKNEVNVTIPINDTSVSDALQNTQSNEDASEPTENETIDTEYFENLGLMIKSKKCTVTSVNDDGSISVTSQGDTVNVKLIGINLSHNSSSIINKVREDLLNKEVRIAFDTSKIESNEYYSYIYVNDNELYNSELLKEGITTLRTERTNVSLNNILAEAQRYAKTNSIGIWS